MTNKLKHVSGKENVADVLSRPADPPLLNSILPNSAGIDYLKMAEEQQSDLDLQNLKQNNTTSLLLKIVPLGKTGATLLCDDSQGRLRPLVPKSMRRAVFQHFHSSSHPEIKSGTKSIGRLMVWRDIKISDNGPKNAKLAPDQRLLGEIRPMSRRSHPVLEDALLTST